MQRIGIFAWLLLFAAAAIASAQTTPTTASAPAATSATSGKPTWETGPFVSTYAISLRSKPALPPDFQNFPYVKPDAPKGGSVTLASVGDFDSFNPFIIRGSAADGVFRVWDTLLRPSLDEPLTAYGHLAKTIDVADDRSWVAFELRPEAHFNDGTPVTAEDAVWTFNTLRDEGRPFYRLYYGDVIEAVAENDHRIVFHLKPGASRELPQTLGELPVLPEHWWKGRDFSAPLMDPPLGSGPYKITNFEFGRYVVYQRVPDYWAVNLPTGRGMFNLGAIHQEYFRDATVAMEAFKAGQIDFRQENVSKNWATAYDFPAVRNGLVKKQEVRHRLPTGIQGFAMNTRRSVFKDARVREAMAYAFDFEWMNKTLFYDAYTRTKSYFSNSDLASSGIPSGAEVALLAPYKSQLPPGLFTESFTLPVTDGSGNNRRQLLYALALLKQAGWDVKDRKLVDRNGNQMTINILLEDPVFERVALPYKASLERLGIVVNVRTVDPSEYQHMVDAFDFDMTVAVFSETDSPGNEQRDNWSCAAAKDQGSGNIIGICNPVVDALIEKVVEAKDYEDLVPATRALDRVLLWSWYMVPQYHSQVFRIAYWNRFGQPGKPMRAGYSLDTWWVDTKLSAATEAARGGAH